MDFKPQHLNFHVTNACNNSCKFCYMNALRLTEGFKELSLSPADIIRVVDEFSLLTTNPSPMIFFTGGEPTIHFQELLKVTEEIKTKHPDFLPGIASNGGLLGATGRYRKGVQHYLEKAGLDSMSPEEAVRALKEKGIWAYTISVDANHNCFEDTDDYSQVPLYCIEKLFRVLLEQGYGKDGRLVLDLTYCPENREKSEAIVARLIKSLGFTRDGNFYVNGEQRIKRIGMDDFAMVGRVAGRKCLSDKEALFSSTCEKLNGKKRSEGPLCFNYQHGPDIDANGDVYFCVGQSFRIGNIYQSSLSEIFQRLRENDGKDYIHKRGIQLVNLIEATAFSGAENCIGELARKAYEKKPDKMKDINIAPAFCWVLGRDEELQKIFLAEEDEWS